MQKLCALLLLAISAWLLVAPFAEAATAQNLLPACCRRAGTHHCAAGATAMHNAQAVGASIRATPCLLMPHRADALVERFGTSNKQLALAFQVTWSPFSSVSAACGYADLLARKSPRGPPCLSLASA